MVTIRMLCLLGKLVNGCRCPRCCRISVDKLLQIQAFNSLIFYINYNYWQWWGRTYTMNDTTSKTKHILLPQRHGLLLNARCWIFPILNILSAFNNARVKPLARKIVPPIILSSYGMFKISFFLRFQLTNWSYEIFCIAIELMLTCSL